MLCITRSKFGDKFLRFCNRGIYSTIKCSVGSSSRCCYSPGFVNRYDYFRGDDKYLTAVEATAFVMQLPSKEREVLLRSLLSVTKGIPVTLKELAEQRLREVEDATQRNDIDATVPSVSTLLFVAVNSALPYVAFGFLDNVIMITAGEYIEIKLGAVFTISTMAAAGLGNMVSDVAGLSFAGYLEGIVTRMHIAAPKVSFKQKGLWQTKAVTIMGRSVGVVIGCLLGMFPLLLYNHKKEVESSE